LLIGRRPTSVLGYYATHILIREMPKMVQDTPADL